VSSRYVHLLAAAGLRLVAPVRRKCPLERVRKILVIGGGGIGDIVMKTPLFACLRRGFPQAEIVFFSSSGPESQIIRGHPAIDRYITLKEREAMIPRHPIEVLGYLRQLRAERFDVTIVTHYGISLKSAAFAYLVGAPIRVGFDKGGRGALHTHRVKVEDTEARHAVDWNLDLAARLGITVDKREMSIYLNAEERRFAADLLTRAGVGPDEVTIALFQGSKRRSRLWLNDRFASLADALTDRYRSRILLFGGEAERPAIEAMAVAMRGAPIVAVGQTIRETAAIIERCGLLVSCDSGPVHIAAALKTPVVALFGPETPARVGPYGERSAVIRHVLPCAPCHDIDCRFGSPRCMEMITVEEVLQVIEQHSAAWGLDPFRRLQKA
jgi:lipopolysaccharide heptosyltransferase II